MSISSVDRSQMEDLKRLSAFYDFISNPVQYKKRVTRLGCMV